MHNHFPHFTLFPSFIRDVQCGKLWCDGKGKIKEKTLGYGTYWTTATLDRRSIYCR